MILLFLERGPYENANYNGKNIMAINYAACVN